MPNRRIEHLRDLIDERDLRYEQRYESQNKALDAALFAAKEAVLKAEVSADKRFELLNELRTGVATTEQVEALEKLITELARRVDRSEGRAAGFGTSWGILVAALGMVATVIFVIVSLK